MISYDVWNCCCIQKYQAYAAEAFLCLLWNLGAIQLSFRDHSFPVHLIFWPVLILVFLFFIILVSLKKHEGLNRHSYENIFTWSANPLLAAQFVSNLLIKAYLLILFYFDGDNVVLWKSVVSAPLYLYLFNKEAYSFT